MIDHADIARRGFDEFRRFVNPLIAQRAAIAEEPVELLRAENGALVDADGKTYEDFHGTQTFGHRPASVAAALRDYLATDAPNWQPSRVNPYVGRLARRLCERSGYDHCFFAMTGADAVEAALKMARARSGRPRLLSLAGAYHGCSYGAMGLMQAGPFKDRFSPQLTGTEQLPFGDIAALEAALGDDVAAIVVEPVQVEGGVRPLPAAYVEALCALTEKHGVLLVADEVQTGLGRTGEGFLRSASWPRVPDVALLGKALGGGLVPLSAMLTRRAIFLDAYGADFAAGESHNATFGFNSVTAVCGLAALDLVTEEAIARARVIGERFRGQLRAQLDGHPLVAEIRGEGVIAGVALNQPDHPWLSLQHFGYSALVDEAVIGPLLCHRLYPHGFYCFSCGHDWSVLRLQARLDIDLAVLDRFAVACRQELDYLAELYL